MQNEDILDKKILQLTKNGAIYYDESKNDFYIDILEPIKNVTHIKILKSSIKLKTKKINTLDVNDNDPLYITINDYSRITTFNTKTEIYEMNSSNITSNYISNAFNTFEVINLNVESKYVTVTNVEYDNLLPIDGITFENVYTSTSASLNDTNVYNIIPYEPSLKRFNIKLYDKNFNLINKDDISNFEMLICVFSNNKKMSMR